MPLNSPLPANGDYDEAEALNSLGAWLYGRGELQHAAHALLQALAIRPAWTHALNNLGLVWRAQNRMAEAEASFRRAIALEPDCVPARNNLAVLLWKLRRLPEAESEYRRILALEPDNAPAHNNFGLVLLDMGRAKDAERALLRALDLGAHTPETHNNLGNALNQQHRIQEAIAAYRRALAQRPDFRVASMNLAMVLLSLGKYEEGWRHYEARYDETTNAPGSGIPRIPYPRWRGESLKGKSLLVWPEQGYGDTLQFCRYLALLKARGVARLGLACPPALQRLFGSLEGVDALYPLDGTGTLPGHDYWCLMMSLPMLFGTTVDTIPSRTPYLSAPAELKRTWREQLPSGRFRVGLAWAGDPRPYDPGLNAVDQRRSIPARLLVPLLRIPDVQFVSLQHEQPSRRQIDDLPPDLRPLDPMDAVTDFADTAAIIECLDLVITVDTSVAHLAGALNKPVWILSRYDGCWRWLRERDDSPWYPGARLFRQTKAGDWDGVVRRVASALGQ